jgi:hypothetical protein
VTEEAGDTGFEGEIAEAVEEVDAGGLHLLGQGVDELDAVLGDGVELVDEGDEVRAFVAGVPFEEGDGDDRFEMGSELGREVVILEDKGSEVSLLGTAVHRSLPLLRPDPVS